MCGADFPLKVSALGEAPAIGYVEEPVRPPGSIAGASRPQPEPRWPISQQQYPARTQTGAPMSIEPPGVAQPNYPQQQVLGAPPSNLQAPPDWQRGGGQPTYNPAPRRRSAAPVEEIETEELPPYARPGAAPIGPPQSARPMPQAFAAARPAAQSAACAVRRRSR